MEGEQKKREKTERMIRTERISYQTAGSVTSNAMTTSIVEKAGNATSAGDNRSYSDRGSRKDGYSDDTLSAKSRRYIKNPLCYGGG